MRHPNLVLAALLTVPAAALAGCTGTSGAPPAADGFAGTPVEVGFTDTAAGFEASRIRGGLNNPSCVAFSPDGAHVAIADSGSGRVLIGTLAGQTDYQTLAGFDTEYWKVAKDPQGNVTSERFKLGPLSVAWAGSSLAITDGGKKDGHETVLFFDTWPAPAVHGAPTNPVGPTSSDPSDLGEGNLTGMTVAPDGDTLYLCGQGADSKSWVLKAQHSTRKLEPLFSADDHGITVNSPMQCLLAGADHLLVLYSGKGGAEDGLIVKWSLAAKTPVAQWTLPGLVDPMGMAWIPHTEALAVVDNNWALTQVNNGKLARVTLPGNGGAAEVDVLATGLKGPVSCAFGPDGRLWITQLGLEFDKDLGELLAVSGFVRR